MTEELRRLVLWDIDLTLVDYHACGISWYAEAFTSVTGVPFRHPPVFAGRTELAITREILSSHDVEPTDEAVHKIWALLENSFRHGKAELLSGGIMLPGSDKALSTVASHGGIVQSVVTGNIPGVARYKLSTFGLDQHLDLGVGGYGSISAHRPDLVTSAVQQASEKYGYNFAPEHVVIIGDTLHDVDAALGHGMKAVAVTTGPHTEAELRAAGAHVVLPDLSDTEAVLTALLTTNSAQ